LVAQFAAHEPEREYVGVVAGTGLPATGTFQSRMITTASQGRRSTRRPGLGEEAITHYRVERTFATAAQVRIRLETGRRNQIRVHFAEAGHPVIGDPRYAPELARHPAWTHPRIALHAATLAFRHPVTEQRLAFTSPLPPELADLIAELDSATPAPPAAAKGSQARPR